MKLKNPSDKKVPAFLVFNLCWSHLTPGVLQDQDNSSQAVLRKAQLWSGGPQQRGPDRSQSPALWVSLGSSWVGQSLFCVAQVWPQWEEQAQVYGAVNVCTRWRDQPRHPGQLLSWRNNFVTKKIISVEGDWPKRPNGQQTAMCVCHATCSGDTNNHHW